MTRRMSPTSLGVCDPLGHSRAHVGGPATERSGELQGRSVWEHGLRVPCALWGCDSRGLRRAPAACVDWRGLCSVVDEGGAGLRVDFSFRVDFSAGRIETYTWATPKKPANSTPSCPSTSPLLFGEPWHDEARVGGCFPQISARPRHPLPPSSRYHTNYHGQGVREQAHRRDQAAPRGLIAERARGQLAVRRGRRHHHGGGAGHRTGGRDPARKERREARAQRPG